MKNLITLLFLFISSLAIAQTSLSSIYKKGKKFTILNVSNTESELGGMGNMKTNNTSKSTLTFADELNDKYSVSYIMNTMKLETEGMGQSSSFDSENPNDKNSQIGETISGMLNVDELYYVDKKTLESTKQNPNEENKSGMMGGLGVLSNNSNIVEQIFLKIPANTAKGSVWNDEKTEKGLTTKKTYKVISIENQIATLEITGTINGTTEREINGGNTINMTIDEKIKGKITVNINTGLISNIELENEGTSEMDMMGQQMNVSSKTKTVTTITE